MEKLMHMLDKGIALLKKGILALISDQGLYLLTAFIFATAMTSSLFMWYADRVKAVTDYVIIPWSVTLCVLRLMRANERDLRSLDTGLLTAMFAWVVIPFLIRFGFTFNNVSNWYGHAVVFFAIYAMTREDAPERRSAMFDRVCAGFALFSFIGAGLLLYTAWTGKTLGDGKGDQTFGIDLGRRIPGYDRNILGMNAQCCVMLCLAGACRRRNLLAKVAHAIPCAMMVLVIMLTQSRTSRIAILAGLAVTAYGCAAAWMRNPSVLIRQAAGVLCAAVVFVGGYVASGVLIEKAVEHYNGGFRSESVFTLVETAMAEEAQAEPAVRSSAAGVVVEGTASFFDRVGIWKNLIKLWRENPKYLVIGNGIGRTGSQIVKGTLEEQRGAVAVHNTYLQLLADFGIVGGTIMLAFFAVVAWHALRVFYARDSRRVPGGRALCGMVMAILITGMMESQPLGANTPMNMMLYYALAILCAEGRQLQKA